jgi:hypothetical protein
MERRAGTRGPGRSAPGRALDHSSMGSGRSRTRQASVCSGVIARPSTQAASHASQSPLQVAPRHRSRYPSCSPPVASRYPFSGEGRRMSAPSWAAPAAPSSDVRLLCGHHLMLCPPGVIAALQIRRLEAHLVKPPRRTGAGRLVRSGAVSDDALRLGLTVGVILLPCRFRGRYDLRGDEVRRATRPTRIRSLRAPTYASSNCRGRRRRSQSGAFPDKPVACVCGGSDRSQSTSEERGGTEYG